MPFMLSHYVQYIVDGSKSCLVSARDAGIKAQR